MNGTLTAGPWTGLRVHDASGATVLHLDPSARAQWVRLAIDALDDGTETLVFRNADREAVIDVSGRVGVAVALTILRAVEARG